MRAVGWGCVRLEGERDDTNGGEAEERGVGGRGERTASGGGGGCAWGGPEGRRVSVGHRGRMIQKTYAVDEGALAAGVDAPAGVEEAREAVAENAAPEAEERVTPWKVQLGKLSYSELWAAR